MAFPEAVCAVITGAGSGLGRAFADAISSRGGRLVLADIDEHGLAETARAIEKHGGEVCTQLCDVRDPTQVDALAKFANEKCGCHADLLINNAGVALGGPIEEASLEDLRWIIDINLWGVIHGCRAFLPAMKEQGHGWILNVASAAGLLAPPDMAAYNLTKAAVVALSETLYSENKLSGIGITVLCPTFFNTQIAQSSRGIRDEQTKAFVQKQMEKSSVQAPEVARCALKALERGELYALPMLDGRTMWRLKRMAPSQFQGLLSWSQKLLEYHLGGSNRMGKR